MVTANRQEARTAESAGLTKPSRRPQRGRPLWSLREDPDRYLIAYYVGRTLAFPFESPTRLARDLAQIHHCEIGSGEEAKRFVAALLEGRPIHLKAKPGSRRGLDDPEDARWRDRDWANAREEELLRKLRRWDKRLRQSGPAADDPGSDLFWLIRMATAWQIVLDRSAYTYRGPDPLTVAARFAAEVGETEYFDQFMKPYPAYFPNFNFDLERPG